MHGPFSADELAGIVSLFEALTRDELDQAIQELAYRHEGTVISKAERMAMIDGAVTDYVLIEDGDVICVGPAAFPVLPAEAEDLPHLLEVSRRTIDRDQIAETLLADLLTQLEDQTDAESVARVRELTYELEAWADVDADTVRKRLPEE